MSGAPITKLQIKTIHAIKSRVRLDPGSYRAMLAGFDVASSTQLTADEADRLLRRMREIPGASTPVQRTVKSKLAAGRYAPKLQAMWLALYNLGAIEDRRDSAMHAFVKRQTGLDHTRFLQEASDAASAIQALKAMLIRSGVVWPAPGSDRTADLLAMKRAILRAQWLRCVALGAVTPFGPPEDCDGLQDYASRIVRGGSRRLGTIEDASLTPAELDEVSRSLGKRVRAAQARKDEMPPGEVRHVG